LQIVSRSQGEDAAHKLDLCMSAGYVVQGDLPNWTGDTTHAQLGPRRKAECDSILKRQNRIDKQQTAAQKRYLAQ
jgi:hypothetical protein